MSFEVSLDYVRTLKNNNNVLFIDVREPSELEKTGSIPGSINIPLPTLEETLQNLTDEDFRTKYGKNKPKLETPLIFTCQIGRRSLDAIHIAKKLGYVDAKHFPGGWIEWEKEMKDANKKDYI